MGVNHFHLFFIPVECKLSRGHDKNKSKNKETKRKENKAMLIPILGPIVPVFVILYCLNK